MIDGCTRLGALWRVVVPLAAPGVFTAGILSFVNAWDEFLLALSLNSNPSMRTLPVGITLYQTEFVFPWPVISAALVVAGQNFGALYIDWELSDPLIVFEINDADGNRVFSHSIMLSSLGFS